MAAERNNARQGRFDQGPLCDPAFAAAHAPLRLHQPMTGAGSGRNTRVATSLALLAPPAA